MFLLKKRPRRLLPLPKLKSESESGPGFSQIFESGSGSGFERKAQNPAGVDSATPVPWPPLVGYSSALEPVCTAVVYRIRLLESNPAGY